MTTSPNPQDASAPAFPTSSGNYAPISSSTGMTLRDYFAAKAMQGDIAASTSQRPDAAGCAAWAYEMADAMLKARQEPSHDS